MVAMTLRRRRNAVGPAADPAAAASYARYSSDQQREQSIADQQRECREAAERNGHRILPEFEYSDSAVSGTKRERDGLNRLLEAAERGEFSSLYLHSLSRLARESVLTMPMLKRLVHIYGVRVICLTEGIDTDTNGWELIASLMAVVHEQYIRELGANVLRGQEGAKLAGLSVGDYCFGYSSEPVDNGATNGRNVKPQMRYVIDEERAEWVRRVFHWFAHDRRSLTWIAKELNRLGAPKDHRSSTPYWRHGLVAELLRREKYVGVWRWGEMCNVRDPETGRVRQEPRSEEETEKWTQRFEHLRIIEDDVFEVAQHRLAENAEKYAANRTGDGTWKAGGGRGSEPRHLLAGLIRCGNCDSTFYVGGANGRYLFCPNYRKGICTCQTTLNRERAERLILAEIGKCIEEDEEWFQLLFERLAAAWRELENRVPVETRALERSLASISAKISRLVDQVEAGIDEPEIKARLRERREEKRKAEQELERLARDRACSTQAPSKVWLRQQLHQLAATLQGDAPAASHALRNLVGGKIVVEEIREPGRSRFYLRGRFTALGSPKILEPMCSQGNDTTVGGRELTIDFIPPKRIDADSELAKEMADGGATNVEIANHTGWSRSHVTKALKHWYESRGLTKPDGRRQRKQ